MYVIVSAKPVLLGESPLQHVNPSRSSQQNFNRHFPFPNASPRPPIPTAHGNRRQRLPSLRAHRREAARLSCVAPGRQPDGVCVRALLRAAWLVRRAELVRERDGEAGGVLRRRAGDCRVREKTLRERRGRAGCLYAALYWAGVTFGFGGVRPGLRSRPCFLCEKRQVTVLYFDLQRRSELLRAAMLRLS